MEKNILNNTFKKMEYHLFNNKNFLDLFGVGKGKLSYDFAIPSKQHGLILIEYNGIQHYEATKFFGGDKQFKIQQEHDHRKREYAKITDTSLLV